MCSNASSPGAPRSIRSTSCCRGMGRLYAMDPATKPQPRKWPPERRDSPSVRRRQSFGNFLRLAGIGMDFLANDAQRDLVKIGLQGAVEFGELRPQDLIDEALRRPDHDGVTSLPMKTIGLQAVALVQSKKEMARPLVGHRELNLDRRIPLA